MVTLSTVPTSPVLFCDAVDFLLPTTLVSFALAPPFTGDYCSWNGQPVDKWVKGFVGDFGRGQYCLEAKSS